MKTYLDCIPCFFRQAIEAGRMAGFSGKKQKKIINELCAALPQLRLSVSPPEIARVVNKILQNNTKDPDLYARIKQKSNNVGLRIYDKLKNKVASSRNKLLTAAEIAILGNIIDYGAKNHLDVNKELDRLLKEEHQTIKQERKGIFNFKEFSSHARKAQNILYLADNAGETVFDRVLIEQILKTYKGKKIIYAVKDKPVINDALIKDAVACGIDKIVEVMSSGSDAPGTVLSLCSEKFLEVYKKADMIISKGQGNFEALSGRKEPIFFLFMAKCPVIAREAKCKVGDLILLHNNKRLK